MNDYAETYIASLVCNPHTKVFLTEEQKSKILYVLMFFCLKRDNTKIFIICDLHTPGDT